MKQNNNNLRYVSFLETHSIDLYFTYIFSLHIQCSFLIQVLKKIQMERKKRLEYEQQRSKRWQSIRIYYLGFFCVIDLIFKINSQKCGEHSGLFLLFFGCWSVQSNTSDVVFVFLFLFLLVLQIIQFLFCLFLFLIWMNLLFFFSFSFNLETHELSDCIAPNSHWVHMHVGVA